MGKRRRHIKPNFKDRGEIETATPAKEDLHRPSGGNRSVPGPGVVCDIDKVTEVQDVYQDSNGATTCHPLIHQRCPEVADIPKCRDCRDLRDRRALKSSADSLLKFALNTTKPGECKSFAVESIHPEQKCNRKELRTDVPETTRESLGRPEPEPKLGSGYEKGGCVLDSRSWMIYLAITELPDEVKALNKNASAFLKVEDYMHELFVVQLKQLLKQADRMRHCLDNCSFKGKVCHHLRLYQSDTVDKIVQKKGSSLKSWDKRLQLPMVQLITRIRNLVLKEMKRDGSFTPSQMKRIPDQVAMLTLPLRMDAVDEDPEKLATFEPMEWIALVTVVISDIYVMILKDQIFLEHVKTLE